MTPGFKQTEVGLIPEDWEVRTIGQVFRLINGCAFKPEDWKEQGTPIIRIQNLNDPAAPFNYSDAPFEARHRVEPGDLLFAWSGTTGTSFGARVWRGPSGVLNQHIFKVITDQRELAPEFSVLVLQRVQEDIEKKAHGFKSSFGHVRRPDLIKVNLPVPPLSEQRAIAAALSDVDALIDALGRLIAKKRDLRQAASQQLLTGKLRLPGFHGRWKTERLGNIADIAMGRTPSRTSPAYWGRGYKWLSIADLHSKVVMESKEEITELAASAMTIIPKGTLLMSFKLSIGRLCFAGCDLFTNEAICSFNELRADAGYLYYALLSTDFSVYGKQAVKGYTLNKESLNIIEVRLPELPEQNAIATVLSDMDAEIAALGHRREKIRALKQGMMQELLTGRTRLV